MLTDSLSDLINNADYPNKYAIYKGEQSAATTTPPSLHKGAGCFIGVPLCLHIYVRVCVTRLNIFILL